MRFRLSLFLTLLACLVLATGCERAGGTSLTAEIDDADYTRGKSLLRQNRNQEAMAAFLKVIDKRGGDAPESHLEVGRLYQEQIKDPIQAIYHYRKYRELKPNAPQAPLVKQLIDSATRDFARTLPAQPLENQVLRNDLLDVVERLQRENTQLRTELATLSSGRTALPGEEPVTGNLGFGVSTPAPSTQLITRAPVESEAPVLTPAPLTQQPSVSGPISVTTPAPATQTPAPAASGGGRRHVVAQGESLFSIARRYYGTPTKAKIAEIVAANRELLPNENAPLKIGMDLRIP